MTYDATEVELPLSDEALPSCDGGDVLWLVIELVLFLVACREENK